MAIIDFFLIVTKILVAGFFGFLFMGIIRKLAARFQNRIGPPIWQPILDFIKLLSKENIVSKRESPWTNLGPIISLAAYISVLFLLPIGLHFDFYGSVIWVIYLLFAGVAGYIIAGFASGNPYGGVGGSRELVQAFGFELPFIISLLVPTLKLLSIASSWFYVYPFAFVAFLIAVQGELALPPFHIPDAEQELVAGVFTELSGWRLGLFELAYAFKIFVLSSLISILFLGGGSFLAVLVKDFFVIIFLALIRVLFARMTIDRSLKFFWFVATPLALIGLARVLFLM